MAMMTREGGGSCDYGANGIREAFRDTNITIAEWIKAPRVVTDKEIEEYLLRMRSRASSKFTYTITRSPKGMQRTVAIIASEYCLE